MDGLGVAGEAEGVTAGGGAEVDGHHHGEGRRLLGTRLAPLEGKEWDQLGLADARKRIKTPRKVFSPMIFGIFFLDFHPIL